MLRPLGDLEPGQRRLVAGLAAAVAALALVAGAAAVARSGGDGAGVRAAGTSTTATATPRPTATAPTTTVARSTTTLGASVTTATTVAVTGPGTTAPTGTAPRATTTTRPVTATTRPPAVTIPVTVPVTVAVTLAPTTTAAPVSCGGSGAAGEVARSFCAYRAAQGLAPMRRSSALDSVAQRWAQQMAADAANGMPPDQAMRHNPDYAAGVQAACSGCGWAENVAFNSTAAGAWQSWLASSGHLANIRNGPNGGLFGVGAATGGGYTFFVQDFGYSG